MSKTVRPIYGLLRKYIKVQFDESHIKDFEVLKKNFIEALINIAPDWESPFELICDGNSIVEGAILGNRKEKSLILSTMPTNL